MRTCSHPADRLTLLFAAQDYITGQRFAISRCRGCDFVVTTPQPGPVEMAAYYPAGYYGAAGGRRFPWLVERLQQSLYGWRVRSVVAAAGAGTRRRVLDVGCGRGLLLREFRRHGWEVQGTELSAPAASYGRDVLGLPVAIGSLETLAFPAHHFDAVTVWHVLEHLPDPRVLLAEVDRILKPGGVLFIGVPNFGGWEARLGRDKWFHLDVPRHLTHLTKATLQRALAQQGFLDRRWSGFAPEYDCFSFVQSALNRCGLRHNLLYNLLRRGTAKVLDRDPVPAWQVAATLLLAAPLGLLSVPATLCAGWFGQAGTLTVLCVKPGPATAV
jgi:SAM-dependent methyltransferase